MRQRFAVPACALLLLVAMALGLAFGSGPFTLFDLFSDPAAREAIVELRLPRTVLGALAGGGLAAVGVACQAVLRNPLAEPYVLGVSGGAALGATVAMAFGAATTSLLGASLIPVAALAGGLAATVIVYGLVRGDERGTSILLAGVVINAIAAAFVTFVKTLVTPEKTQELLEWLTGFIGDADTTGWSRIGFVGAYVTLGFAVLLFDAGRLNLLALGDDAAHHLGVDVRRLERRTFFACSAVVGAIVSVTGLIGFVGLVVPHVLRRVFGPDVRVLLPASIFGGGAVLVACNVVAKLVLRWSGHEPPVGAVTALLGGPIFLALLRRRDVG